MRKAILRYPYIPVQLAYALFSNFLVMTVPSTEQANSSPGRPSDQNALDRHQRHGEHSHIGAVYSPLYTHIPGSLSMSIRCGKPTHASTIGFGLALNLQRCPRAFVIPVTVPPGNVL